MKRIVLYNILRCIFVVDNVVDVKLEMASLSITVALLLEYVSDAS